MTDAPTISASALTSVTLRDFGEERRLLRTNAVPAGHTTHGDRLSVHVEISGDPRPHRPDEMEPTVCINVVGQSSGDPQDDAWIEITDPDALDQLIAALTAAGPVLRQLRKEA